MTIRKVILSQEAADFIEECVITEDVSTLPKAGDLCDIHEGADDAGELVVAIFEHDEREYWIPRWMAVHLKYEGQ